MVLAAEWQLVGAVPYEQREPRQGLPNVQFPCNFLVVKFILPKAMLFCRKPRQSQSIVQLACLESNQSCHQTTLGSPDPLSFDVADAAD